jgi:hypothetical protein
MCVNITHCHCCGREYCSHNPNLVRCVKCCKCWCEHCFNVIDGGEWDTLCKSCRSDDDGKLGQCCGCGKNIRNKRYTPMSEPDYFDYNQNSCHNLNHKHVYCIKCALRPYIVYPFAKSSGDYYNRICIQRKLLQRQQNFTETISFYQRQLANNNNDKIRTFENIGECKNTLTQQLFEFYSETCPLKQTSRECYCE